MPLQPTFLLYHFCAHGSVDGGPGSSVSEARQSQICFSRRLEKSLKSGSETPCCFPAAVVILVDCVKAAATGFHCPELGSGTDLRRDGACLSCSGSFQWPLSLVIDGELGQEETGALNRLRESTYASPGMAGIVARFREFGHRAACLGPTALDECNQSLES